jgi:uncharacterized protein
MLHYDGPWIDTAASSRALKMISPELLEILRCPMDPSHTRLALQQEHLVCERCRTRFRIRDGFPVLVIEEAELPPGCTSIDDLPCRREPGGPTK